MTRCETLVGTQIRRCGEKDPNADSNKTFTGGSKLETQDQELEDDPTGDEGRLRQ